MQRAAHRMVLVGAHFLECCGRIHVPEDAQCIVAAVLDDSGNQLVIENADAAGLYDDVRLTRSCENG